MRYRRGFSLTELVVALLIGALLLLAAFNLLATNSTMLRTRDSAADLAARATLALDALESDVQLAGFYGLSNAGSDFAFLQGGDMAAALPAVQLRQAAAPLAALPVAAQACGVNFAIDLSRPVESDNNAFALGRNRTAACAPRGGARPGADTLTLRHAASRAAVAADPGRVQLVVSRTDPAQRWLLNDGVLPPAPALQPLRVQLHDLVVQSYYIASSSVGTPGLPALRLKSLTTVGGSAAFVDTEVMSGIEDLQVRLLTASGSYDADRLPAGETVRAVQLWLLLRAAQAEPGFFDTLDYVYADRVYALTAVERRYRRLLVSRTIGLRNAPLS